VFPRCGNHPSGYVKDRFFFLLSDMQYILKKKSGLWSLFVNSVFESFNKVIVYKETVIITQCNVLITSCVLLCSLSFIQSSSRG
jgi:hypothetical protein